MFVKGDEPDGLLSLAGMVNSGAFGVLVSLQLARTELAQAYEVGLIQRTPVPNLSAEDRDILAELARRAWSLKRALDTRTENSHAFTLPAMLQVEGGDTLAERAAAWGERVRATDAELAAIQAEIDDRCFELYGIGEDDRRAITEGFGGAAAGAAGGAEADVSPEDADDDADELATAADAAGLTAELLSWAVGLAFGRFDVRLATGERAIPPEPEPFDPLPVCSPGMLTGTDGLPLAAPPAEYPLDWPSDGILVDDPGHPRDLTEAARLAFEEAFAPPTPCPPPPQAGEGEPVRRLPLSHV
ncbi:MAG: hypothetical protein AB7K36_25395, partial [Chloroflexota bacterium]